MNGPAWTLGIETSCDETSAAVLRGDGTLAGHVILSQDVHGIYGGVVPEIAAREHLVRIDAVADAALREAGVGLDQIELFAATAGPGLIGALLVGVTWAKSAAWALGRPVVGVHHMEAHLWATRLENPQAEPPFVALLVSGGHTMLLWVPGWGEYQLLGETRDDAAGEALDKAAKLLGLSYPGGPAVERAAAAGDPKRHPLPLPLVNGTSEPEHPDHFDFSFSGLKTALRTRARALEADGTLAVEVPHLAAAFQEAVVETLVRKTLRAVRKTRCQRVVLGGGVANNRVLRERLAAKLTPRGELFAPSPRLSTDNGAMVARAGLFRFRCEGASGYDLSARADLPFPGLVRPPASR